ncbi:ATP-dependent helicase [Haliscomenobacter hydrossis]|uniref:DNA 3'-5' helicase n=1 Tax=Haliscomenobacter hydrossis (strain ATCC 27775 / DSM 1100 / LMG 10767 / O) TaxID=760192 RepID=F4L570_HALH1|nr:UvrD-helicase domain-containing protein [Haliscomenobacter hydrossis]AEE49750.1 UvrD/REP helicase [Haliscomenobacter hydrossis DSM 1100]
MSYLDELNPVQRQAVENTDGPVLVVAGPGSGKTRVLTYRIAHIMEKGVAPWEILSLTFTNKAAREMQERISKVVGDKARNVWSGTFHSIFARILRVEADKIGYSPNFTIYDTEDTKSVIGAIIKEMNLDKTVYNVNTIRSRISSAKSSLITPRLYAENEAMKMQDRQAKMPFISDIYLKYGERCKRAGAMDFDDLLYRLYELWQKNPEVLDKYRKRFRYLLVDEFQDTNTLQYGIIRKLVHFEGSPRNICVVGDDAQSIYAFRGATIQNILDFEKDFSPFGIKVFKLEENYRSTEHIVQAANEVIRFNKKQIQKKIWSSKGTGQKIKVIKTMTDAEEGKRVADTISEQRNRFHLRNTDIAVLYRTNAQSRVLEEYLRRYNIPYKIFGGLSFYQRKEVKDLIGYLRLAVNPKDEEALRRVINFPKRGIGDSTLDKISELAGQQNLTMWEVLLHIDAGTRTQKSIHEFVKIVQDSGQKAESLNAHEAAMYIAKQSKLIEEYNQDKTVEGLGRLENLNALLDGIKSFVEDDEFETASEQQNKSLASYLQNIALLTDQDDESKNGDYVTLMSVHSAKGLEFKSVFVVGLEEKLFPSFMSMDTPDGLDEERRLFYVAITRAEQYLTLTFSMSRYKFGQMQYNEMSRFIEEIPRDHLESTSALRSGFSADFEPTPSRTTTTAVPSKSGVSGAFKPRPASSNAAPRIDPALFKASPSDQIKVGNTVLHLKFGEGKVLNIDGGKDNRIATIFFEAADDGQEKRIMLKFAKLQIVE